MPSKDPFSASIVHIKYSNRVIFEGRNHGEQVKDGYIVRALPTKNANFPLDDAVEGVFINYMQDLELGLDIVIYCSICLHMSIIEMETSTKTVQIIPNLSNHKYRN